MILLDYSNLFWDLLLLEHSVWVYISFVSSVCELVTSGVYPQALRAGAIPSSGPK